MSADLAIVDQGGARVGGGLSRQQRAVVNHKGNAVVTAVAGSGKTTTIVAVDREALEARRVVVAYNKSVQETLAARGVRNARTVHSLGWSALTRSGRWTLDKDKVRKIAQDNMVVPPEILRLVSLAKLSGVGAFLPDTVETWGNLADHHGIELIGEADRRKLLYAAQGLLRLSNDRSDVADFDDQVYLPLLRNLPLPRFDLLCVDEAQDLNATRQELVARMSAGRLVIVGDERQAVYGFTGADHESMRRTAARHGCDPLSLSVSFRCSRAVVEVAQEWCPEIESAPGAEEGEVRWVERISDERLGHGDAVLSRTTAPLVKLAYRLLGEGIPARVMGRDIGKGIVATIRRLRASDIPSLTAKAEKWRLWEVKRLRDAGKPAEADSVDDKAESLLAVLGHLRPRSIDAAIAGVEALFSDARGGVELATIHKAKGLEWDRVFILNRDLLPPAWNARLNPWQQVQEENLLYVATTRARRELVLVRGDAVSRERHTRLLEWATGA